MSLRTRRIGEQLRGEIARILREEASDPGLRMVTLTRVDVAPDLSHALVFWSIVDLNDNTDVESVAAALERVARFVRRRVARELPLRRSPELRFRHDPSIELGSRMLSILRSLQDDEKT